MAKRTRNMRKVNGNECVDGSERETDKKLPECVFQKSVPFVFLRLKSPRRRN